MAATETVALPFFNRIVTAKRGPAPRFHAGPQAAPSAGGNVQDWFDLNLESPLGVLKVLHYQCPMSRWFYLSLLIALAPTARGAAPALDFNRDIQPILSDNCYPCHGPDEKERKAKLRLDTKEGAFRVKDGVAVIVPGQSARSELYRRITTTDADDHMPPAKSNRKLTAIPSKSCPYISAPADPGLSLQLTYLLV